MLNTVLLQLLLAGNVSASLPLDLPEAASTTTCNYAAALPDAHGRKGIRKPDPRNGDDDHDDNDLKKQAPISSNKKRVSDLNPPGVSPLIGGWLQTRDETTILLVADRQNSLHPEHDPASASYSGRRAPGPYHGDDPHGDDPHGNDPHDEIHDAKLPANQHKDDGYPSNDPYNGSVPNGRTPY
jgi:hypothetical protein